MSLIKQSINNRNKNKRSKSSGSLLKNGKLEKNVPSRSAFIKNRKIKFVKNNTEKGINSQEKLLNLLSNEHDDYSGHVLNINETITSQEKNDRLSNFQPSRANKRVSKSRIPRRPVVTANKLSGFRSVTRIILLKKSSTKLKALSDTIVTETEKSDYEAAAELKVEDSDENKFPESSEFSPLEKKVSLPLCNDDSYFDDDVESDNDATGDCDDDDDGSGETSKDFDYDTSVSCPCESCVNKYKQREELLHQLKYKHWSTNDVLKSARYLNSSSSEEEEEESSSDSSEVIEKKIYRRHTREVYHSPRRPKPQFQEKKCTYLFFQILFDIIFWPFVLFRRTK